MDLLQGLDERVKQLENNSRRAAQGAAKIMEDIDGMKNEFTTYRNKVASDLVEQLFTNDDSIKKQIESIQQQLLNDVPEAFTLQASKLEERANSLEAMLGAVMGEVSNRPTVHDIATPATRPPTATDP